MARPDANATNEVREDPQTVDDAPFPDALRTALGQGELRLHYQPVVSFRHSGVVGFEALLRWAHPRHGLLGPAAFLPTAERSGLMPAIGTWVLEEACRAAATWAAESRHEPPLSIRVNVSAVELGAALVAAVERALVVSGLPAELLVVEVRERDVTASHGNAVAVLSRLAALGVRCSIDDFGKGGFSLALLQQMPVHGLKIDPVFVRGLGTERDDSALVGDIVRRAHSLDLTVTAEGIETPRQLSEVRSLGCDDGQGYYFARPQPGEVVRALVHHPFRWRERDSVA